MKDHTSAPEKNTSRWTRFSSGLPLLLLAGSVLSVSNGRWILPWAAWLAPVLLMRYFRTSSSLWRGLAALWLVHFVTAPIAWFGLWPFPPLVMARIMAIGALLALLPYWLDRLSRHHLEGIPQTLVFPASAVAIEFVGSLGSGTTWGNLAYTQTDNLSLLQFAAVAGIWGVTFLILWLAPVVNNFWQAGWRLRHCRVSLATYTVTLGLVLVGGSARLVLFAPEGEHIRVASVSPPEIVDLETEEGRQFFMDLQRIFTKQDVDAETASRVRTTLTATYDRLFEDTRRQARSGATLIAWPEASLISFDEDMDRALIDRGRRLAREEGVYLGLSIALVPLAPDHRNENRLLIIDPSGEIEQTYWKHQTVPIVEEPYAVAGSPKVAAKTSPLATLGAVICYDMDSPRYLRDAGNSGIDVLMAPSGDWPAIKDLHPRMAIVRAVEQGFSLIRPANHGVTIAADYQGRVLGRMDHYTASDRQMTAWIPRAGTQTLYTHLGDVLPWSCLLASAFLIVFLVWRTFAIGSRQSHDRPPLAVESTPK